MNEQVSRRWPLVLAAAAIVLAGFAVYSNSFSDAFVFDDIIHIPDNPAIRHLWPLWDVMRPVETFSSRPLVSLSLALNYALGGLDIHGYHVFNLTVHLLAALVLLGIVRRTLSGARLGGRFGHAATLGAAIVAVAWTVHPLQTESVTYIIQRAESMMGLFYLLTLYCFIRATTPGARPGAWIAASVAASALGMCTKEVMATVPVAVLLYDRAFVSSSFAEALRRRWVYYAALAATLLILLGLALSTPLSNTVGFHVPGISVVDYARSEARIIVTHYLRLVFWPQPLILDYGMAPVQSFIGAGFPALLTLVLAVGTVVLFRRSPPLGFPLAWFFLVLVPTSSFIPVADLVFEHRMYLPLAGLLALFVAPVALVRGRVVRVLLFAGIAGYIGFWGMLTYARNRDYQSEIAFCTDTIAKVPDNPRAWNNLGDSLGTVGRHSEAIRCYDKVLAMNPGYARAWNNKGYELNMLGRASEALGCFDKAIEINPQYGKAWFNKGDSLNKLGRPSEALACFDKAIEIDPRNPVAWFNKGNILNKLGRASEALTCYDMALKIDPRNADAWINKGNSLNMLGRYSEAIPCYDKALEINPQNLAAWNNRGNALNLLGRYPEAIEDYEHALKIDPRCVEAWSNKGDSLNKLGRPSDALISLDKALEIDPRCAAAWSNKGDSLNQLGRPSDALISLDKALEINPRYAEALYNKAIAQEKLGDRQAAIQSCRRCLEAARADGGQRAWIPKAEAHLRELEKK